MKAERGSALMTVIFIVFITATIGAAVSSLIMINYKLRMLDNRIGRAEYSTEKIVDAAYLAAQEAVSNTINTQFKEAQAQIAEAIKEEMNNLHGEGFDYSYGKVENGEYIISENKVNIKTNEVFVDLYKANLHDNILAQVFEKVETVLDIEQDSYTFNEDEFGKSGMAEFAIVLSEPIIVYGNVTEKLTIYYKTEDSPTIQFLVDFIIYTPTYEDVYAKTYDLNSLVGITNWNMQDWGYL